VAMSPAGSPLAPWAISKRNKLSLVSTDKAANAAAASDDSMFPV